MKTPSTDFFEPSFLLQTMMGPNAVRIAEEMAAYLTLRPGMRVLDLGCGMGLTSIFLAKRYNVTVTAADLWISPADNAERFAAFGLGDAVTPVSVDAAKGLPFAREYFDVLFSVDSYHYFGANETMLPSLLPYLKPGGQVAVAVPGLKADFVNGEIPAVLQPYWQPDMHFHSTSWWRALWEKADGFTVAACREMDCCKAAWDDWLKCPNPYAQGDIAMMKAENGQYFNIVQITGTKAL